MNSKKARKKQSRPQPIELDPQRFYTTEECCQLLRCSNPTLVRLRRDETNPFPMKLVGKGIALGADIQKWFAAQQDRPVKPRQRRKLAAASK